MAIIKADLEGSVRLAEISADQLTVQHVRRHLGEVFDKPMLEGFELYYVADGEELVLIDSDEEFLAGLCENGSPFRVTIVPVAYGMQSLASCGMSLMEGAEELVSDEGETAEEHVERVVEDDDASSSSSSSSDEQDEQGEQDGDDSDASDAEEVKVACELSEEKAVESEPAAASDDSTAPPASTNDQEDKKAKKARKQEEKQQRKKHAKMQKTQLDDEQLLQLATERLRQLSPALTDLQPEQLRVFMRILCFEFTKLVKAGILKPAEVGPAAKRHQARDGKHRRKPINLPPACIQALRDGGLEASDETIQALVNTIRVQPRRFHRLGLVPSSSSSSSSESETAPRRHHRKETNGRHARHGWPFAAHHQHHHFEAPQDASSDEEWAAGLPANSDILFEQAALRTGVELSGAELKAFMRLLRISFDRLQSAGLLSEMEVRGDGTGSDQLADKLPKMHQGLVFKLQFFAPFFAEILQAHDLVLEPAVVQRLMDVLRVRPRRFAKAGLIDEDVWHQQINAFREERARQRSMGGVAGLGRWFASMLGMSEPQPSAHPHHHPHHPAPHHRHHMHGPHGGPHGPHGPRPFHAPHSRPCGGPRPFHCPRFAATAPPAAATPATGCGERETDRRFPTNASMAQVVPVEGRQRGKVVSSGVRFEQRWKVQNKHTHPWPATVELIADNDDAVTLGVRESVRMTLPVQPEQSVDIAVSMEAPTAPGLYRPRFRLRDANTGLAFGQRLVTEVLVVDPTQPQLHEPQLPPRPQFGGWRRRGMMRGCADY